MTRSETAKLWAERMMRFEQAEMTVAQFCATEGVSQPSFYKWRRKLQSLSANSSSSVSTFVPVQLPTPASATRTSTGSVSTTIDLLGGVRICIKVPSERPSNSTEQAPQ